MFYNVEPISTRLATSRPILTMRSARPSSNLENVDNFENRSDDSNDDEDDLPPTNLTRRDREASAIEDDVGTIDRRLADLYQINNEWDERMQRILPTVRPPRDPERSINLCYRNLVDQYVTLVKRYFNVSRNRDTVSAC